MAGKAPRKSFMSGMFSGRKSAAEKPEMASKMGHMDKTFFGDDGDEEEMLGAKFREGTGLLDEEPDRAETDFYNGDKYVGDTTGAKRHGHGVYYYDSGDKYTGNWNMGKQEGHGV